MHADFDPHDLFRKSANEKRRRRRHEFVTRSLDCSHLVPVFNVGSRLRPAENVTPKGKNKATPTVFALDLSDEIKHASGGALRQRLVGELAGYGRSEVRASIQRTGWCFLSPLWPEDMGM